MDSLSPARDTEAAARRALPRGRVFWLALFGLLGGLVGGVVASGDLLLRFVLIPAAAASVGAMVGFLGALRSARLPLDSSAPAPQTPEPLPHQLPQSRPMPQALHLGPDPWEGAGALGEPSTFALSDAEGMSMPLAAGQEEGERGAMTVARYLSHDGLRLTRPSEHELERARRAVAKIVADLAPQPGAFDAVCERLIAVGETMAADLAVLGRETTDYEKVLGIDLFDRLTQTRVTQPGLEVMKWVRWVLSALHQDGARDDDEFFSPVAVAMASRYGGTSEQWLSEIAEPFEHVELGGVVEKIALAAKASSYERTTLPDPDEVDRILEVPQWM